MYNLKWKLNINFRIIVLATLLFFINLYLSEGFFILYFGNLILK